MDRHEALWVNLLLDLLASFSIVFVVNAIKYIVGVEWAELLYLIAYTYTLSSPLSFIDHFVCFFVCLCSPEDCYFAGQSDLIPEFTLQIEGVSVLYRAQADALKIVLLW